MPKKHPVIAAIEERMATRAEEISDIDIGMETLTARRAMLVRQQAEDQGMLAAAALKKPRTKKEAATDIAAKEESNG